MKVNNIQRKYLLVVGIIILCGTALFAVSKADIFKQVAVSQKLIIKCLVENSSSYEKSRFWFFFSKFFDIWGF